VYVLRNWKEFYIKADFDDKITYTWDSNSTFLFLGTPEFKREDYSQVGYNVILIVIDSLRRDALGCNGQKISTSPNIDLLCKEGLEDAPRIEHCCCCISSSWPRLHCSHVDAL
jgi:hypothetical protein